MTNATAPTPSDKTVKPTKGLADWIEVFRAGDHVDSAGKKCSFSVADLDQMVANVALGKPPAVLGHPAHDDPAYAWAELKRDGDYLFARFDEINPAFEQGVRTGAYKNRSVYVVHDKQNGWRVRHIGWLGAKPPAIDGLKPVQFASQEEDGHEFSAGDPEFDAVTQLAWGLEGAARLLRGFREYLIEQSGMETADRVLPTWSIDDLQASAERARTALAQPDTDDTPVSSFSQPDGGVMPFTQEDIDRARDEAAQEAERKFAAQGQELAELRAARITEKVDVQVNSLVAQGVVLPADAPGMKAFMAALETSEAKEFSFSAADNQEVKQTPSQWFAAFMSSRKPLVKLGRDSRLDEVPVDEKSTDATEIANKAKAFMADQAAKGITVSLADAVAKFSNAQA